MVAAEALRPLFTTGRLLGRSRAVGFEGTPAAVGDFDRSYAHMFSVMKMCLHE